MFAMLGAFFRMLTNLFMTGEVITANLYMEQIKSIKDETEDLTEEDLQKIRDKIKALHKKKAENG